MIPLDFPAMMLLGGVAASPLVPYVLEQFGAGPSDVSLRRSSRTELGLADYLPYEELLEHDLVLTTFGALGAMYELAFADTSSVDDFALQGHSEWINVALRHFGAGWGHHTYTLRTTADPPAQPKCIPSDAHRILAESHLAHVAGVRYGLRHLVALTYVPPVEQQKWIHKLIFTGESPLETSYERVRDDFERGLGSYEDNIRRVGSIRRLGTHPTDQTRNELLEAIFQVLYDDPQPIRVGVPFKPAAIGGLLAARDVNPVGMRPKIGSKHLRVLGVYGYPSQSEPGMMESFLRVPVSGCRFSTRSVFVDPERAKAKLDSCRRMWAGQKTSLAEKVIPGGLDERVDRFAAENEDLIETAIAVLQTGKVARVHYCAKVVFLNEDLDALSVGIREVKRALTTAGLTTKEETLNTFDAYLGHVPFDGHHDVREGLVDTLNAARLWPSSSRWPGRKTWNCKQCGLVTVPVLVGVTDTGEDFAWDPHDDEDSQSFVAIGAPGAGKTTDLNTQAAGYLREPNDQVFGIDKNRGQLVTTAFLGGDYREDQRYSLFDGLEDGEKRDYLGRFLAKLAALNGFPVEADHREKIKSALEGMLEHERVRDRSLSTFLGLQLGPRDKEGKLTEVLAQYAEGGAHKGIFDGVGSRRGTNRYEVHELGSLLGGNQDDLVAAPALIWILHSFEERFPGHRTIVLVDEAWAALKSSRVADLLNEQVRTLRFRHAGIGFFTHSLSDIRESGIGKIVFAACKSRLLYPNPEASPEFRNLYESLELTDAQIERIRRGVLKRDCFLQVNGQFGAFRLPRSRAELAVYGCTGFDEVAAARRLMVEHPEDWRERHLRAYGCDREADRLRSLRRQGTLNPLTIRQELAAR